MNRKRKNEAKNRTLQNILFSMLLQEEDESKAKRSLIVLCDLHRRKVWFDDRTANAICTSCFHSSSRIMIAALSFLLGYDLPEEVEDSDASSSEDEMTLQKAHVILNRESVYQAVHKGTIAGKKKKKRVKLQCAIQSIKRQQHDTSEKSTPNHYSPLNQLKDVQINIRRIRRKMSKKDRLALVRLGREDRGWYVPCPAVKSSKLVGVSIREKDPKKAMALAAKRAKVARSRQRKKILKQRSDKQF